MEINNKKKFETRKPSPLYTPDLAPSDIHIFGLLKKDLRGRRFESDMDVRDAVKSDFPTNKKPFTRKALKFGIH
ncbi:hypothetical protein NPIL_316891 [Nephila pilipes]|uniref:Uncharacterized protein n=1 Tax=Nephila pilipes TaxID=299642 RepID=A0A8X6PIV8_NEPPI|nr:hypothetical protein NPIL_316891 [Nephila pilipes]